MDGNQTNLLMLIHFYSRPAQRQKKVSSVLLKSWSRKSFRPRDCGKLKTREVSRLLAEEEMREGVDVAAIAACCEGQYRL